ncbi:MAG: cytidine deaminase [Candidatus Pseudobacter hemicellulosilyticus]|uniref:Cytidine deaminase n=1 Tax=Candidatus Pseudobacter hemicellulosilyticus TaxID=3121375 RepID=A0AAJ5WRJ2_9BACT|nr:MAG: cytidine deaminase [Pseudobacter sp.]
MKKNDYHFSYEIYTGAEELNSADSSLLEEARRICEKAYAPYSQFKVGAVALLANGQLVRGTNQENASYPAGTCAEHSLLATAGTLFPGLPIDAMAISYHSGHGESNQPCSPCGICRQALHEFELRVGRPIRLILGGLTGPVIVVDKASQLLPLGFTADMLGK